MLEHGRRGGSKVVDDSKELVLCDRGLDILDKQILLFFALLQNLLGLVLDCQVLFVKELGANQHVFFVSLDIALSIEFLNDLFGVLFAINGELGCVVFFLGLRNNELVVDVLYADALLKMVSDFLGVPGRRKVVNKKVERIV